MSDDDYDVGYGKPPTKTRFKKGQSGNPNGRPKKTKDLETLAGKMLSELVSVTIDGERRQVTVAEATIMKIRNDILTGSSLERTRSLKTLKEICPDAYFPEKDLPPTHVIVNFVDSDNCGGVYNPTEHEENVLKALWRMHRAKMLDLDALLKSVGGQLDSAPQFYNAPAEEGIDASK